MPSGVAGIRIFRLDFQTGAWVLSGTGTTSADGARILSGAGQGLAATGWHAIVVDTFCETEVVGTVTTNSGQPIEGAVVTSLNGVTGTTDAAGRFALAGVPLPSNGFDVLVTVAPPAGGGFEADESGDHPGECGATTDIGTVRLDTVATDAVAPTVASTSPASDATDVADNAAVSITFDETMSTGSLNGDTLGLFLGDDAVAGFIGVSTSLGQTTATFVPSAPLETGSEYRFRVTTEAMDAFGNGLDEAFEFTFTTEADATGGTVTVDVTPDSPSGGFPGITETLSAAVTDAAGNTVAGATVTWTTSDPSVAEIDATGVVTTLAPGTTTIRGTFGDAFDEVTYSVSTPVADSVTLTAGTTALAAGTSLALVATARDSSSNPLDGFDFAWTSSDETIATVDAAGVVRGVLAGGPVTITATEQFSGQSANVAITVIDPTAVDAVTVTAETDAIGPDVSLQMEAVAFDSMQAAIPGVTFTWSSSNTSIATVSATGAVTAVGSGTVAIQATAVGSTDVTGTTDLDVYAFEPTVIRFELGDSTALGSPQLDVVLHDAATGQSLDGLSTDSDLTVDFGFVDVERVHVTFYESQFLPSPRGDSGPTAYTTVMDLPRGRRTLNYTPNPGSAIEFDASFPVGVDTITASSGDDVEGTLCETESSTS
ncbi:MAG: Ig-like domain-containing protein, partial [Planctomycetota bacterium]